MHFEGKTRVIASALLLLMLVGCAADTATTPVETETPEKQAEDTAEPTSAVEENAGYTKADNLFSINYNPDVSLNPLYGVNTYNEVLFSLLYEGLFRLGDGFVPEAVLCSDYSTEDGITYYFHLREGVLFHDGTPLTASDVEYTINRAAAGNKYKSRLANIRAVHAEDDLTLSIVLFSANYSLPALLDIPVIKYGTGDDTSPVGTGPYIMARDSDPAVLEKFTDYRDADKLPLDTIYLRNLDAGDVARAFSGKVLDILSFDPTGTQTLNIHMDYETRYCDTANLVYLGFNTERGAGSSPAVRRAISCLVNRDAICADIFGDAVTPAPLVLSPALAYYDTAWETGTDYSRSRFLELAAEAGIEDYSDDGFWDDAFGVADLSITFIVNSDNAYKVAAAREITSELQANGFKIELKELSYEDYLEELAAGTYNLYLGEVRLMPDFDLTAMLTEDGDLNYGRINDDSYAELIASFLSASGEAERTEAMRALCEYVRDEAAIIPLCYKKTAVITHIGEVSGLKTSPSGVFSYITDWKVTLE